MSFWDFFRHRKTGQIISKDCHAKLPPKDKEHFEAAPKGTTKATHTVTIQEPVHDPDSGFMTSYLMSEMIGMPVGNNLAGAILGAEASGRSVGGEYSGPTAYPGPDSSPAPDVSQNDVGGDMGASAGAAGGDIGGGSDFSGGGSDFGSGGDSGF